MTNIVRIDVEGQSFKLKPLNAIMVTVDRKTFIYNRNLKRFEKPVPDLLTEKRAKDIIENYFPYKGK